MKKLLLSFLTLALFLNIFSNAFGADVYIFKLKEIATPNLILDTTNKPDTTLDSCKTHLKTLMDTKKYTLVQDCTKVSSAPADTTKYYFTWQDTAGGYKTEREIVGKTACETERTTGGYKITTPCSTTSDKVNIDAFNKTSGNYAFTWQMDNLLLKQTRKGGGDTVTACNLDRTGKIIDLTPTQLKSWNNTKVCADVKNAVEPYYFNWEDLTTKNKTELVFASKKECDSEQVNTKYTNATSCYTPSQKLTINTYNNSTVVDPQKEPTPFDSEYKLLAPIGNLESIGGDSDNKIGDYLNIILMIAIGLCGALAVIMIVVRGVQYMGDESVFGKTEAKHHIMQAVLGLLLALGAYAILNTINPKLVGGSLTFNSVNIELDGSPMTSNDAVPPPGTKVARCPEGIVTIETSGGKLPVCKSFSTNLKSLIDTAWAEGYKIYGYGFRTSASQINLRKRHCGGDSYYNIYLKPSGKCIPPTATPGNSMHESGLAFDFTCEGASITSRSNKCFIWLQKNASKYGLKNLSSEPWHWSTNGN